MPRVLEVAQGLRVPLAPVQAERGVDKDILPSSSPAAPLEGVWVWAPSEASHRQ